MKIFETVVIDVWEFVARHPLVGVAAGLFVTGLIVQQIRMDLRQK